MFELIQRDGYTEETIAESEELEEIARLSVEKSGLQEDDLFDWMRGED